MRDLINYDPETGILTWKVRQGRAQAGQTAGTTRHDGYITIKVNGKKRYAHRLAWYLVTGSWPKGEIDHINHDTSDNRWENLRDVSKAENGFHRAGLQSNNTSGVTGVGWHKRRQKWYAWVRTTHLGVFDNFDDAVAARVDAQ